MTKCRLMPAMVVLVLVGAGTMGLSQKQVSANQGSAAGPEMTPSIEGTVWSGKDSDGDYYQYHFLKGGHLNYDTNTSRKEVETIVDKGIWAQNGEIVIIAINHYSTQTGTISGDHMGGEAWNFNGRRWTWGVDQKR